MVGYKWARIGDELIRFHIHILAVSQGHIQSPMEEVPPFKPAV